jgi:hypothetical protein
VPSRGPLVAVEEPKAEGSDPFLARYLGIVWGNSPGCLDSYQCPAHVEFGSSGGPHHGDRSSQMYSPIMRYMTPRNPNPMRLNAAKVTEAVIQTPSFVTRFESFLAR